MKTVGKGLHVNADTPSRHIDAGYDWLWLRGNSAIATETYGGWQGLMFYTNIVRNGGKWKNQETDKAGWSFDMRYGTSADYFELCRTSATDLAAGVNFFSPLIRILGPTRSMGFGGTMPTFNSLSGAALSIDASGNVGINTTTPTEKLGVSGSISASVYVKTGGLKTSIVTKTANYTATTSDHTILADASAGPLTITLPSASTAANQEIVVKKIDSSANVVTVDPNASETWDGASNKVLSTQYAVANGQCDGSNWLAITNV